jgi:hypothetical protein
MINRTSLSLVFALMLCVGLLNAQAPVKYREFELGSNVAAVATISGVAASDVKVIHQRPALVQALEWRPRYTYGSAASSPDPVDRMVFTFYNDQLYKVVVDYDARRTEGITQADVVAALSATYGTATVPTGRIRETQYGQPDVRLASWGDAEYSVTLFRVAYPNTFRLVVSSTRLDLLAAAAGVEAVRLDALEAPQRELVRVRVAADAARVAEEEAKRVNLPGFRP